MNTLTLSPTYIYAAWGHHMVRYASVVKPKLNARHTSTRGLRGMSAASTGIYFRYCNSCSSARLHRALRPLSFLASILPFPSDPSAKAKCKIQHFTSLRKVSQRLVLSRPSCTHTQLFHMNMRVAPPSCAPSLQWSQHL